MSGKDLARARYCSSYLLVECRLSVGTDVQCVFRRLHVPDVVWQSSDDTFQRRDPKRSVMLK